MITLQVINLAKVFTLLCLNFYAFYYGFHGTRQILYYSMHVSYVIWWLLEQILFPLRSSLILQQYCDTNSAIFVLIIVGWGYSLPGYLCFSNTSHSTISAFETITGLMIYIIGFVFNASCDAYILGAKTINLKARITNGIFTLFPSPQYIGDWMRYGAMAFISGNIYSYFVVLFIICINVKSIQEKKMKTTP